MIRKHTPKVDEDALQTAAIHKVRKARAGDRQSGIEILDDCRPALRDLIQNQALPDAERTIYLGLLLCALDEIIDGVEPSRALCIEDLHHRQPDPNKIRRDLAIYFEVGTVYERLIARGRTKNDSPIKDAQRSTAKKLGLSLQTVQKVWSEYGSLKMWRSVPWVEISEGS